MLPFAIRLHNASHMQGLGASPAQLVFGSRIDLDRHILLPAAQRAQASSSSSTMDEWVTEQQTLQDQVMERAQSLERQRHAAHVAEQPPPAREKKPQKPKELPPYTEFPIGSYVLVDYPESRPHKLMALRRGPFKVLERRENAYKLLNLVTRKEEPWRPVQLLREYHYDPARTDPAKEALKDYPNFYVIERIISHQGRMDQKGSLRFQVKWQDSEDLTMEPWANIKFSAPLHEYLRANGLERFIPKKLAQA